MLIKVIFTGGTISGKTCGDTISLGDAPYSLLERYSGDDVRFETEEPYSILSEQLSAQHWLGLSDCIAKCLDGCDAVIVVHGTDSLCYTAAYLGYVFADSDKPILLVSSGYPLDDPRANGRANFKAAVSFAKSRRRGVYAVWYADGMAQLHMGTRILRQAAYSDMLCSIGGRAAEGSGLFSLPDKLDGFGQIAAVQCMPLMRYPLAEGLRAVLITAYHSGTLCTDERFAAFVNDAHKCGAEIFAAGTGGRDAEYETAARFKELGVTALPKASPDAMYVKLGLAVSQGLQLKAAMLTPCGGDFILKDGRIC